MTLLYLLPFLAALNGINIKVASFNVRLDQSGVVLLLYVMLAGMILGKIKFYLDKSGKLLLIFFLWSFTTSFLFAPSVKYSVIQTVNVFSAAAVYFILTNLLRSMKLIDRYFQFFLMAGIAATGYGVVIFVLSLMGLRFPGVNLTDTYSVAYGVFATMREPNIFGSFSLIYFILCFVIILILPAKKRRYNHLIVMALVTSSLGMLLSFTRGVWLAAGLGVLAALTLQKKLFKVSRQKAISIITLGFYLVLLFFLASLFVSKFIFNYKISHILDFKGGTGAGRLEIWKIALKSIRTNLLFGHGTYSFAILFPSQVSGPENASWIGNIFLTILHDTGIIGTFFFLWMIILLFKEGIKAAKRLMETDPTAAAISFGLCFSLACMFIAFLFTTAFSFVYAWSVLGLIGAFVRYAKQHERDSKPRPR